MIAEIQPDAWQEKSAIPSHANSLPRTLSEQIQQHEMQRQHAAFTVGTTEAVRENRSTPLVNYTESDPEDGSASPAANPGKSWRSTRSIDDMKAELQQTAEANGQAFKHFLLKASSNASLPVSDAS